MQKNYFLKRDTKVRFFSQKCHQSLAETTKNKQREAIFYYYSYINFASCYTCISVPLRGRNYTNFTKSHK